MIATLLQSAGLFARVLAVGAMLAAPAGLIAYSKVADLGISKTGAGLVLFVTLQRQAMS
ncbi:hypothetical protein [Ensifer soli]|uniref:hypothetical protein n=1 Tax=Ciceribacter sp. sgz301302 TaxID=3342379 RepID=UPI0035B7DFF3